MAIDARLNEILFKLWMMGKSLEELVGLYEGTAEEFSMSSLYRSMLQYAWKERREKILSKVREGIDEEIELFTSEKIKTLHVIMSLTSDIVQRGYQDYLKNPSKHPDWVPSSMKDIDILYKLHDFVVSGGVEKNAISIKRADQLLSTPLPDGVARQMLQLLSEASTQDLVRKASGVIDAEFSEAKKDDDDLLKLSQLVDNNEDKDP